MALKEKIARMIKNFFLPKELEVDPDELTYKQINALSDRRTISQLLFYRTCIEKDGYIFYEQADGRIGIVFRLYPPHFPISEDEKNIISLLNDIMIDDAIVHIMTYASSNIKDTMDLFKEMHSNPPNVKHPEALQVYVNDMHEKYNDYANKSLMGEVADSRLRNFINIISVLFPYGVEMFTVKQTYNKIKGILKDYAIRELPPSELIPILNEIFDHTKEYYPKSNDNITNINKQITKNATVKLSKNDNILHLNGNWMAKVLTVDKYPEEIELSQYKDIFFDSFGRDFQVNLPCPFLNTLVIRYKNIKKQRKSVLDKAKWNIGQLSGLPPIVFKKKPSLKKRKAENELVVQYIEELGEVPVDAFWSLTIFEKDYEKLVQYTAAIKKAFMQTKGEWIIKEEKFSQIAFQTFLMSLPLQYSEIIHENIDKFDKNFRSNNAQIAPLITGFRGNGKPGFLFFDRTGQLINIDLFNSDNYNFCVIGPMGSGKSFWTNYFLAQALSQGWDVRMIDFGYSYEKLCEIAGGEFISFGKKVVDGKRVKGDKLTPAEADEIVQNSQVCLNFFTHMTTITNKEGKKVPAGEEIELIVPIIGMMTGVDLAEIYMQEGDKLVLTAIANTIAKAVRRAYEMSGKDAGMREVLLALQEIRDEYRETDNSEMVNRINLLIPALYEYANKDGRFYHIFNGANNINLNNSLVVLEMDDIQRSALKPVVGLAFMLRVAQEVFIKHQEDKSKKRLFGVDEAKQLLTNSLFARYLDDFSRKFRKYGGVPGTITQLTEDYFFNKESQAIFKTSDWKIFLPHAKDAVDQVVKGNYLTLNGFQIELFKSINSFYPHYGEFYLKHKRFEGVCRLKATPYAYFLATTNPNDKAKLEQIKERYNISIQDAVFFAAKKVEGWSDEKILYEINNKDNSLKNINFEMFFKKALNENLIETEYSSIYDKDFNCSFKEAIPVLLHESRKLTPSNWLYKAEELDLLSDIEYKFFALIKDIEDISINLNLKNLSDNDFFNIVLDSAKKYIEIEVNSELNRHKNSLIELKNRHKLIYDNVDFFKVNLSYLLSVKPDFLKIKVDYLKEYDKDELKNFLFLFRSIDIKTIASFIDTEDDYIYAKDLGIEYFQGYYFKELEDGHDS